MRHIFLASSCFRDARLPENGPMNRRHFLEYAAVMASTLGAREAMARDPSPAPFLLGATPYFHQASTRAVDTIMKAVSDRALHRTRWDLHDLAGDIPLIAQRNILDEPATYSAGILLERAEDDLRACTAQLAQVPFPLARIIHRCHPEAARIPVIARASGRHVIVDMPRPWEWQLICQFSLAPPVPSAPDERYIEDFQRAWMTMGDILRAEERLTAEVAGLVAPRLLEDTLAGEIAVIECIMEDGHLARTEVIES